MPTYVNSDKGDGCRAPGRPGQALQAADSDHVLGAIESYPDDARPDSLDLTSTTLFGEFRYLGVDRPPTPGAA